MQNSHHITFKSRKLNDIKLELCSAREGDDFHYALPLHMEKTFARVQNYGQDL